MTTGYRIDDPGAAYFLTFTVVDWVDIFTRQVYRDIVIDSFRFCRMEKGLKIWGYVIMSNHIHAILSADHKNLPTILCQFKRHTASTILKAIKNTPESRRDWMLKRFEFAARSNIRNAFHQFWEHDNHGKILLTLDFTLQKLDYIHLNPVKAGLVDKPEDWIYSSARNYACKKSILEVDVMDIGLKLKCL